jgi:hypothetical protein
VVDDEEDAIIVTGTWSIGPERADIARNSQWDSGSKRARKAELYSPPEVSGESKSSPEASGSSEPLLLLLFGCTCIDVVLHDEDDEDDDEGVVGEHTASTIDCAH